MNAPKKNTEIISSLLNGHTPADASECESLRRILTLVSSAKNPFSRDEFHPGHLTAAAFVLNPTWDRVMLIFHAKLHLWLQPGGHFEPGESDPSVAAAREVLEETALQTRWPGEAPRLLDVDVHPIPAWKHEPPHSHFDLRMLLIADPNDAIIGEGVKEARWFGPDDFPSLNLDPGIRRALKKVKLHP